MKVIVNADPKLKFIPARLINFTLRHVAEVFLNLIERKSQNLGEEYLQLIQEKQEFYDQVRIKCAKTLSNPTPSL